jgi:hypothetical protein
MKQHVRTYSHGENGEQQAAAATSAAREVCATGTATSEHLRLKTGGTYCAHRCSIHPAAAAFVHVGSSFGGHGERLLKSRLGPSTWQDISFDLRATAGMSTRTVNMAGKDICFILHAAAALIHGRRHAPLQLFGLAFPGIAPTDSALAPCSRSLQTGAPLVTPRSSDGSCRRGLRCGIGHH